MPDSHSLDDSGRITSRAATSSFVCYADVLRSRVALPLALDPNLLPLRPLVTITLRMVEIGWLTSIRAFEDYIVGITRVCEVQLPIVPFFPPQTH